MDADQLRLILLLAGMVLVVAIYLWDRYKRSRTRLKGLSLRQARKMRKELGLDGLEESSAQVPSFSAVDDLEVPLDAGPVEHQEELFADLDGEPPSSLTVEPEPPLNAGFAGQAAQVSREPGRAGATAGQDAQVSAGPVTNSAAQEHYPPGASGTDSDLPELVVQIGLVRKEGVFTGRDLDAAMQEAGLQPGAMNIYHRYDERHPDRVLFSVASMVEPGYFPFGQMEGFSTPGLLLFTQLPGVRDGMEIYSEMLYAANQLAGTLGGVLQDESHSTLSKQTIQHTRDAILEHRRKLRLARMK